MAWVRENRAPKLVVVENVIGTLTSHSGTDFVSIFRAFVESGYRAGALIINAAPFLPQSRPRLFVIGVHARTPIAVINIWCAIRTVAHENPNRGSRELPGIARNWVWWTLPVPKKTIPSLSSIIEDRPTGTVGTMNRQQKDFYD